MLKNSNATWLVVARMLCRVAEHFDSRRARPCAPVFPDRGSLFRSVNAPTISLVDFVGRIDYYAGCSEACYVLAFIYIDRVLQRNPGLEFDSRNAHR